MGDWEFLLDENVERDVGSCLRRHGYRTEQVVSALEPGADDLTAVLPYARAEDLIVVTKDLSDFSALAPADHNGLILIHNHQLTPSTCVPEYVGSSLPIDLVMTAATTSNSSTSGSST